MKKISKRSVALISTFVITAGLASSAFSQVGALSDDSGAIPIFENADGIRRADFSSFGESGFFTNKDTVIDLAEGIKFITSGSSNEDPVIEKGLWHSDEAGTFNYRLNTNGAARWTDKKDELRRAIILEDIEIGDKIEIVYGTSLVSELNELVGIDGSGDEGKAVLTIGEEYVSDANAVPPVIVKDTYPQTPFKYTTIADRNGTYYYFDPNHNYQIYAVKVTEYRNSVDGETEYVREVDFSQFADTTFTSDGDTHVNLADGIRFIAYGSAKKQPVIEHGTWSNENVGTYNYRLNTNSGSEKLKSEFADLRIAIIIDDVKVGDEIEVVFGASSKYFTLNELINLEEIEEEYTVVSATEKSQTPYKFTRIAEKSGTYYYYNPNHSYHIYGVKVTSRTNSSIGNNVREVDFSRFSDSDFAANTDTVIDLSGGIEFHTAGSANENPIIEHSRWRGDDAIYKTRLNTKGKGTWLNTNYDDLRRAVVIKDVNVGDEIEIVYGSSSLNRRMNMFIVDENNNYFSLNSEYDSEKDSDDSDDDDEFLIWDSYSFDDDEYGTSVLTAEESHKPYRYTTIARKSGTYYYFDPAGTYHIYDVKVTAAPYVQEKLVKLQLFNEINDNGTLTDNFTLTNISNLTLNDLEIYLNAFNEIDGIGEILFTYPNGTIEVIPFVNGEADIENIELFYPALERDPTDNGINILAPSEFIKGHFTISE